MTEKDQEYLKKKYIDGKSYEDLIGYLEDFNFEGDPPLFLRELDAKYSAEREKVALKDLRYAIVVLSGFILNIILWILDVKFPNRVLVVIATAFIWIPFFRCFWTVYKSREKFNH